MFETWEAVRTMRNALLQETDWTQLPDAACDQWSYRLYRQHLRNIPEKFATPQEVVFPEPPPAEQDPNIE